MTPEQLHEIREKWTSASGPEGSTCASERITHAISDIARLLEEIERLRNCCDEITRQYARLCYRTLNGIEEAGPQPPRAPAA